MRALEDGTPTITVRDSVTIAGWTLVSRAIGALSNIIWPCRDDKIMPVTSQRVVLQLWARLSATGAPLCYRICGTAGWAWHKFPEDWALYIENRGRLVTQ